MPTEQDNHPESAAPYPAPVAWPSRVMRAGAIAALFAVILAIGLVLPGWIHGSGPAMRGISIVGQGRGAASGIPVPKGAKELRAMTGRRDTRNSVRWYGASIAASRAVAFYEYVMKEKGWHLTHSLATSADMPGTQLRYSNAAGDLCTILITINDNGCYIGIVRVPAAGAPQEPRP